MFGIHGSVILSSDTGTAVTVVLFVYGNDVGTAVTVVLFVYGNDVGTGVTVVLFVYGNDVGTAVTAVLFIYVGMNHQKLQKNKHRSDDPQLKQIFIKHNELFGEFSTKNFIVASTCCDNNTLNS